MGLIGELPETGMTNNTALLSSYEFMLVYIAGNSPFNLRDTLIGGELKH